MSRSASRRSSQLRQLGSDQAVLGAREQLDVRARVAVAHLDEPAGLLEPLERVLAHGLEHREAAVRAARKQAVIGERGDPVERGRPAHRLGGGEGEAAAEHTELAEQELGLGVEQVVAPADRRAQGLLALRRVARTRAQEIQPAAEAVEDLGGGEDLDAGGRELDRQRQAIEAVADARDHRLVAVGEGQARVDGPRAAQEQRDRGLGGERAERELVLGGQPQRRAARDHELGAR